MIHLIKIILFLLVNFGGYNVITLTVWITRQIGIYPALPPGIDFEEFNFLLYEGGFLVWALCALVSIGYFIVPHKELRTWLILAPLYGTFLYTAGLMVYFNFKDLIF